VIARFELIPINDRTTLLHLIDGAGRSGWGECSPLEGRSRETGAACAAELERVLADHPPVALDPAAIAAAVSTIGAPAARFALETALLDLAARARGVSLARLLAEHPAPRLACSAVVPPSGEGAPPGIATWKVKVGDLDRLDQDLAELARSVPPGVRLRLDVNRRWTGVEAVQHLPRLARLAPEWIEEPASAGELLAQTLPPVPLALDESVCDAEADTEEALARGLVRVLVLKPAILGGLAAVAAWAERARRAGAVPVVSHLFDGPIALAACAELALALARPGDPAAGLGPHRGLSGLPGVRVPQLIDGTHLVSHGPGLGVSP
jgi:o-succinylbenzoate synthase